MYAYFRKGTAITTFTIVHFTGIFLVFSFFICFSVRKKNVLNAGLLHQTGQKKGEIIGWNFFTSRHLGGNSNDITKRLSSHLAEIFLCRQARLIIFGFQMYVQVPKSSIKVLILEFHCKVGSFS